MPQLPNLQVTILRHRTSDPATISRDSHPRKKPLDRPQNCVIVILRWPWSLRFNLNQNTKMPPENLEKEIEEILLRMLRAKERLVILKCAEFCREIAEAFHKTEKDDFGKMATVGARACETALLNLIQEINNETAH